MINHVTALDINSQLIVQQKPAPSYLTSGHKDNSKRNSLTEAPAFFHQRNSCVSFILTYAFPQGVAVSKVSTASLSYPFSLATHPFQFSNTRTNISRIQKFGS